MCLCWNSDPLPRVQVCLTSCPWENLVRLRLRLAFKGRWAGPHRFWAGPRPPLAIAFLFPFSFFFLVFFLYFCRGDFNRSIDFFNFARIQWVFLEFYRVYWVKLAFTGFYWVLLGFTRLYWVLLGFNGFNEVSLSFAQFYWTVAWFYWVLQGFTGFYWVLLGFTGYYWVLPSSNQISLGFW